MKPHLNSKTFWILAALIVFDAVQASADLWLPQVVVIANALAGVALLALRIDDRRKYIAAGLPLPEKKPKKKKAPPAGTALLLLLVLALFLGGCASWPKTCETEIFGKTSCGCAKRTFRFEAHPAGKPYPAARIVHICDGEDIPFEDVTDDVRLPRCVEVP